MKCNHCGTLEAQVQDLEVKHSRLATCYITNVQVLTKEIRRLAQRDTLFQEIVRLVKEQVKDSMQSSLLNSKELSEPCISEAWLKSLQNNKFLNPHESTPAKSSRRSSGIKVPLIEQQNFSLNLENQQLRRQVSQLAGELKQLRMETQATVKLSRVRSHSTINSGCDDSPSADHQAGAFGRALTKGLVRCQVCKARFMPFEFMRHRQQCRGL